MLSENISTLIYFECDKMYQSKVSVPEIWYFVAGLDIQRGQSEKNSPACKKKGVQGCEAILVIYSFFRSLIRVYDLLVVVNESRSETGGMGFILAGC